MIKGTYALPMIEGIFLQSHHLDYRIGKIKLFDWLEENHVRIQAIFKELHVAYMERKNISVECR